jgi:hypothetical protein
MALERLETGVPPPTSDSGFHRSSSRTRRNRKGEGALTTVRNGEGREFRMISSAYLASALVIGIALGAVLPLM